MKFFKNNAAGFVFPNANENINLTVQQYGRAVTTIPMHGASPIYWAVGHGFWTNGGGVNPFTLHFYKGAKPTISEIDTVVSAAQLSSFRAADRLLTATSNTPVCTVTQSLLTATFPSTSVASGTGQATWFIASFLPVSGGVSENVFFVGSIGVIGSGADLELSETNIVQGVNYQPPNYSLRFLPLGFEF